MNPSCLSLNERVCLNHAEDCSDKADQFNGQIRVLPKGWKPGENDVVVGRGKRCYDHSGNIKFRRLVNMMMQEYIRAKTRNEKSIIITALVDHVRRISPHGGFVKHNSATGQFYEVGDLAAREKTSQTFRDALHEHYASSNKSKRRRKQLRLAELLTERNDNYIETLERIPSLQLQLSTSEKMNFPFESSIAGGKGSTLLFDELLSRLSESCANLGNPFEPVPIEEVTVLPPITESCNNPETGNSYHAPGGLRI